MIAKQDMTVSGLIYVDKLFKSRVLKVLTLDLIKGQSKFHLIHKHYDNYVLHYDKNVFIVGNVIHLDRKQNTELSIVWETSIRQ